MVSDSASCCGLQTRTQRHDQEMVNEKHRKKNKTEPTIIDFVIGIDSHKNMNFVGRFSEGISAEIFGEFLGDSLVTVDRV